MSKKDADAYLAGYDTSKGAIRFPIGEPLPATFIRKLGRGRAWVEPAGLEGAATVCPTSERAGALFAVEA